MDYILLSVTLSSWLMIALRIFLALAVYNDAEANYISKPKLWAVLCGIFVAIPGIIYLLTVRREAKNSIMCPHCARKIPKDVRICPVCRVELEPGAAFVGKETAARQKKAKIFTVLLIVCAALLMILLIINFFYGLMNFNLDGGSYRFTVNL